MRLILVICMCLSASFAQATRVSCTGSDIDYDMSTIFNFAKQDVGYNLQISQKIDYYHTYCDTPGSCPTRESFDRTEEGQSLNYSFTSCNFNKDHSVLECWNNQSYNRITIKKIVTTAPISGGQVHSFTSYKMELISDLIKNESELIKGSDAQTNYFSLTFENCAF